MGEEVRIEDETLLSHDWGSLTRYTIALRRRSGDWQQQRREVYDHGSAAALLLCDPARGTVVLTRQFRLPVHLNGDAPALIEVCAGLLDGDLPEDCARREAEEESGYRVETITHAFDAYMSPGSLTEKLSCFIGFYDEGQRVSEGGGLVHEGEDIEVLELPFAAALGMIATGEITDAKTIMLLQHAALSGVFPAR